MIIKFLLKRIKIKVEDRLQEQEAGLRGGRWTVDQTFELRQIVRKSLKYALSIYSDFMDVEMHMIWSGENGCGWL